MFGNLEFDINNVIYALSIMGKGMLGIFIVTAVIVLIISALNHFTNKKEQ